MVFFAILVFCHDALWVQQIWYFIILICHLGWAPSLLSYASMQKDSYFSINQVSFHYLISWISNTEIKYHFLYKTFILNVSPESCLKKKKRKKESQFVTLSGLDINLFCPDILVFSILHINVLRTSEKVTPVSEASGQFARTDFLEFGNVNKLNKTTTTKSNLITIVLSQNLICRLQVKNYYWEILYVRNNWLRYQTMAAHAATIYFMLLHLFLEVNHSSISEMWYVFEMYHYSKMPRTWISSSQ